MPRVCPYIQSSNLRSSTLHFLHSGTKNQIAVSHWCRCNRSVSFPKFSVLVPMVGKDYYYYYLFLSIGGSIVFIRVCLYMEKILKNRWWVQKNFWYVWVLMWHERIRIWNRSGIRQGIFINSYIYFPLYELLRSYFRLQVFLRLSPLKVHSWFLLELSRHCCF